MKLDILDRAVGHIRFIEDKKSPARLARASQSGEAKVVDEKEAGRAEGTKSGLLDMFFKPANDLRASWVVYKK